MAYDFQFSFNALQILELTDNFAGALDLSIFAKVGSSI